MNREKEGILDVALLLIGEVIVSLLVIGLHLLFDLLFEAEFWDFSYRVITGAALGSVVTVANYAILTATVNKAISNFLRLRGTREMSEEEVIQFTNENSMQIQNAIKLSFIIRTVSILATLVVAFLLDWFAPLATVIPLIMFRPIITAAEFLKRKFINGALPSESVPSAITYGEDEIGEVARELPADEYTLPSDVFDKGKESDE
jgi:hypothetical protein